MAQFYSANRRVATQQTLNVTCHDLDGFGQGVARHQGKTIFIPGLLPGEQAEVRITEDQRQFSRGRVTKRLNDSPQRVTPRCPHYGVCGGCQQQHISQQLQQRSKAATLRSLLTRETGAAIGDVVSVGADAYGYRRRARLGLEYRQKSRALAMGYRQARSSDVVDITRCPILAGGLEQLLAPLKELLAGLRAVKRLGHVELVMADNGPLVVLRHLDALAGEDRQRLLDFASRRRVMMWLAAGGDSLECLWGEPPVYQIDDLRLQFSPRDFIQVNDEVNRRMVALALEWLEPGADERVLDLFCGMGNFTLPLAKRCGQVIGVEGVAALVANGQYNAQQNLLSNVTFFHDNLEEDVAAKSWADRGFDKILLDPARAGALGVMSHIAAWSPRRIVYVSCNPTTLARDSKVLMASGYVPARVAMLDMFPHSGHLESMTLFLKDSGVCAK
ncbi:23S rRNA (uracil(1939)-C(5))-methyltransferase RlmD [Acerihabitans arboris]|uniref:23S rRNA (uracil(1939)-C(5))-methyltransferase RlmD n=1 Tax=Acerihabitans arboris TaxID=2691583 RepID=A0A845SBC6_9GAMM|nr:23S rRNA (uracil(1939)-C(5))-methyltransferase RlmD [Acerihabitans arboris]NDL61219.1 23S rRNA (uracil(1939)-C(5))-methyltransferase RlmD [Acerihabitans arboris]